MKKVTNVMRDEVVVLQDCVHSIVVECCHENFSEKHLKSKLETMGWIVNHLLKKCEE